MESCQARPVSLAFPPISNPCRRPSLDDVLADRGQPPYTLTAFMAYLSQNHCLETLEFTLDAQRYGEHYDAAVEDTGQFPILPNGPKSQHLCMLFQRLLSAYIVPGAPREINLSSQVRDNLLSHSQTGMPPRPSSLDAGVKRMRDLMDDSIFIPFLNSRTVSVSPTPDDYAAGCKVRQRSTGQLSSAPMSGLGASRSTGHRSSTRGSTSGDSASGHLTDDSGSMPSSSSGCDPMTPPMTPPSSDFHSPRGGRQENTWKKMGMKFGWKK